MVQALMDILITLAALVGILDYFGLKPKQLPSVRAMPLNRKWKLAIMLGLVAAALGMSAYSFYRSFRPKIVEKVIEKPVEKVVEKLVPQECPPVDTHSKKASRDAAKQPTPTQSQSGQSNTQTGPITQGPGSALSFGQTGGITGGTVYVGDPHPDPHFDWKQEKAQNSVFPAVDITIDVDGPMYTPAFGALCNHPCSEQQISPKPWGVVMPQTLYSKDNPRVIGFLAQQPNPLMPGFSLVWRITSREAGELKIENVWRVKPESIGK
jgi:hypothetical protein